MLYTPLNAFWIHSVECRELPASGSCFNQSFPAVSAEGAFCASQRFLETYVGRMTSLEGVEVALSTHSGLSARQIQRPLADSTPQQRGIVAWRYAKCFLVFTAELRCTDIPAGVGDFSNVGLA